MSVRFGCDSRSLETASFRPVVEAEAILATPALKSCLKKSSTTKKQIDESVNKLVTFTVGMDSRTAYNICCSGSERRG